MKTKRKIGAILAPLILLAACVVPPASAPVSQAAAVPVAPAPVVHDPVADSNACYDEARKGDAKAAIAHCSRAIESGELNDADTVAALLNRGVAHKREGQFNLAIDDYSQALQLAPGDAMVLTNRANASRELGLLDSALYDVNTAIQAKPDYAAAYYVRGSIYEILREENLAQADFGRAHELAPDHPDYLAKLEQTEAPDVKQ